MKYSHTAAPGQSSIEHERAAESVTKNVEVFLTYGNVNTCKHGARKEGTDEVTSHFDLAFAKLDFDFVLQAHLVCLARKYSFIMLLGWLFAMDRHLGCWEGYRLLHY